MQLLSTSESNNAELIFLIFCEFFVCSFEVGVTVISWCSAFGRAPNHILEDLYNTARTTVPSASAAILHN